MLLALILPSRKLKDNNGVSAATGIGCNGKDNSQVTIIDTITATNGCCHVHLWRNIGTLVVVGCTATAVGGFGSVVLFVFALVGVPCSKRLHFWSAAGSNSSVVCCSRVDCHRVIKFGSGCHTPLWFAFSSIRRCHGCWCYVMFVVVCAMSDLSDSLLRGGMILSPGDVVKDVALWQNSVSCKSCVVWRNQ